MQTGRNGGFSFGNNAGIRNALARQTDSPDYVFLLNPDTLVEPGAIGKLIDFMEAHPNVGLTGSRMMYPDGRMQMSSFRFHSVWSEVENSVRLGVVSKLLKNKQVVIPLPDVPVQVDWVGGASMMIRRAVIDQIGLLDETYFVYYEETDYCLRAKRAGWSSWYIPQSVIVHLEGQSTGVSDKESAQAPPAVLVCLAPALLCPQSRLAHRADGRCAVDARFCFLSRSSIRAAQARYRSAAFPAGLREIQLSFLAAPSLTHMRKLTNRIHRRAGVGSSHPL